MTSELAEKVLGDIVKWKVEYLELEKQSQKATRDMEHFEDLTSSQFAHLAEVRANTICKTTTLVAPITLIALITRISRITPIGQSRHRGVREIVGPLRRVHEGPGGDDRRTVGQFSRQNPHLRRFQQSVDETAERVWSANHPHHPHHPNHSNHPMNP